VFKDVPIKIVVPVIVVTWILSLFSALAIVYSVPGLIGVGEGAITWDKIADGAVITAKLADGNVTSAKILNGTIIAVDLANGSIITVTIADGAVTYSKIADGAVTNSKIADGAVTNGKIADGAVTNGKMALGAIPFSSNSSVTQYSTSSTSWVDMPNNTVSVTVQRPSTLWIMFSTDAYNAAGSWVYVQALVNGSTGPAPNTMLLTGSTFWGSYACNFYYYANATSYPATFTVSIQWEVIGGTGYVGTRALAVMALP
jgi:hypothetical protein